MIKEKLKQLTGHNYVYLTSRGDAAIKEALKDCKQVLIPEEGGWLSYKKLPKSYVEVKCNNAKIDLTDLKKKIETNQFDALLYQNPGGYFAEQPMKEIYEICDRRCKVIMDVSGAIGTKLCDGRYAEIMVGSFGHWKLVEAGKGGFISSNKELNISEFDDSEVLEKIKLALTNLSKKIEDLTKKKKQVISDLKNYNILFPGDLGFVVIVEGHSPEVIDYCKKNQLEFTFCPRYIRVNKEAISIEIKRLKGHSLF